MKNAMLGPHGSSVKGLRDPRREAPGRSSRVAPGRRSSPPRGPGSRPRAMPSPAPGPPWRPSTRRPAGS